MYFFANCRTFLNFSKWKALGDFLISFLEIVISSGCLGGISHNSIFRNWFEILDVSRHWFLRLLPCSWRSVEWEIAIALPFRGSTPLFGLYGDVPLDRVWVFCDIFMIWTEGPDNLKIFIDYLNNIHSTIKFTSSHSSTNIPFLDVSVSLTNDGSISTDLYTKPTDKHQHLLYSSCHPSHTKKAIPFSLALRLRRICSTDATFHTRTAQLTTYLLKRGYNRNFVNKQIRRAADIPRQLTLQTKDVNKPKRIPFITTFNPSLPHISHIIKKHFNLLLSSHRCKSVFQHPPVVAFRRSPNLRDLLVTAKLPFNSTHPQLPSGSFRCGKNCATCPYICHGFTTYTFFSTGETRPIKSNLTCETKNLIYMIQCNRCNLQYIGETKRRLKDRFNEHRRTVDNPNNKSKPTTAAEHFLSSPNHTANDMLLIPIEKIFSNRDSIRKAREAFLIQKGKTIDPDGLNIREETY